MGFGNVRVVLFPVLADGMEVCSVVQLMMGPCRVVEVMRENVRPGWDGQVRVNEAGALSVMMRVKLFVRSVGSSPSWLSVKSEVPSESVSARSTFDSPGLMRPLLSVSSWWSKSPSPSESTVSFPSVV